MGHEMKVRRFSPLLVGLLVLLLNSCAPYKPTVNSAGYADENIQEVLQNIERAQAESNWFALQGENNYGSYFNLSLALGTLLAGIITAIEGTKLWKRTAKPRLVVVFVLAFIVTANSALGLFLKSESERFLRENRQRYTDLSNGLNSAIREFYFNFRREEFNDQNIALKKAQFLDMASSTFKQIDKLKLDYGQKFGLQTNPHID